MRRILAVVAAASATLACGASYQAIYEGDVRFEHCYALEENPQKSLRDKTDCWRDWSDHYTYGQTRDRIQYAIARYVALSEVGAGPTDEALMMAAPGMTPRETTISAPQPTNAFAPPPKTLPQDGGTDASYGAPPPPPAPPPAPAPPPPLDALPASDCANACQASYRACHLACDAPYKKCMTSCFAPAAAK